MGLVSKIKSVTSLDEVIATDEFFRLIEKWKCIYGGYLSDWHDIKYVTIDGHRSRRMHSLNIGKVVSEQLARLIFNEKVEIHISPDQYGDQIMDVLNGNSFYKLFQDNLEYMFATGGMVMKVFAEQGADGAYRIRLGFVTADCFVPISYSNNGINEGLFINQSRKGDKWYTHLEWHTWAGAEYSIINELYVSDSPQEIGVKVPLSTLYPDLPENVTVSGLTRPLFVYFKPNIANNFDMQSPLGISVYSNSLDTIKALDIAFDSYINEFRLGRKRIIVPAQAVKTVVDPQTGEHRRYFDATDEVYEAFNFETIENQQIIDNSVELRVEDHIAGINALLEILAMQIGFSAGSFTFDGQSVKTATEIISEQSATFRTVTSHEVVIGEGLKQLITTIGEVASLYGIFSPPADIDVRVEWDDSIVIDEKEQQLYYLTFYNAGLTSKVYTLMQTLGLTEEEAQEMIQARAEEDRSLNPDLEALAPGE